MSLWLVVLSDQLPIIALVGRYPTNKLIGRRPLLWRLSALASPPCGALALWGISSSFPELSPARGQVTYVLRTRPPLSWVAPGPHDLHVLGPPLAFTLSQDQTLLANYSKFLAPDSLP